MHNKCNIYIDVNINTTVEVKLTELGLKVLTEYCFKYFGDIDITPDAYIKSLTNKDGYAMFSMWDFMNIFGKSMYMGSDPVIENNNIKIYLYR